MKNKMKKKLNQERLKEEKRWKKKSEGYIYINIFFSCVHDRAYRYPDFLKEKGGGSLDYYIITFKSWFSSVSVHKKKDTRKEEDIDSWN